MDKINSLRKKIDKIDGKMAKLFTARMQTVEKIGVEKAKNGTSIADENREKEIVENLKAVVPESFHIELEEFYDGIFRISKNRQSKGGKK